MSLESQQQSTASQLRKPSRLWLLLLGNLLAVSLILVALFGHVSLYNSPALLILLSAAGVVALVGIAWMPRATRGRLARGAAGVLGCAVVVLLVTEFAARKLNIGGIAYYADSGRYFDALLPDPELAYRHRPGFHQVISGAEVKINSRGLRDAEHDLRKSSGVFRILVLGDSVVFGWGVPADARFTDLLERKLNAASAAGVSSRRFEVINTGVGSYGAHQELVYFRKEGVRYEPDLVLLFHVANDANWLDPQAPVRERPGVHPTYGLEQKTVTGLRWLEERSVIVQLCLQRSVAHLKNLEQTATLQPHNPYWLSCRKCLRELRAECAARHIPLVVFSAGVFDSPLTRLQNQRLREVADADGVPLETNWFPLDGRSARELINSPIDQHWNARGHELVAAGILKVLQHRNLLPR